MAKNLVTLDLDNTLYEFRPYGTCSTAAATAAKSVAISDFTLCTGATVIVKFTTTNTATNPTLNVNSTGAKSLNLNNIKLIANNTYEFRYNGSTWDCIAISDIPKATKNNIGGIKSANDRTAASNLLSGPINSGGTTATRYYGIETTSDGIGFVNVPWKDYILPEATSSTLGGIKVGYTQSGKNYPVVLDDNSKAYVNVPWTNENTNYAKKLNVASSVSSNKLLKNTTYVLTNQTININDIEEPSDGEVATYNLILKNCDIQFNKKIYWYNGTKPENTNILFIEIVITGVKTGSTTIYTATFGTYSEV